MKYIKTYETFKVKNITIDDIIKCIKSDGFIYATIVKDLIDNDPKEPLKALNVDNDGTVTIEYDGREYDVELKNIEKIDY